MQQAYEWQGMVWQIVGIRVGGIGGTRETETRSCIAANAKVNATFVAAGIWRDAKAMDDSQRPAKISECNANTQNKLCGKSEEACVSARYLYTYRYICMYLADMRCVYSTKEQATKNSQKM